MQYRQGKKEKLAELALLYRMVKWRLFKTATTPCDGFATVFTFDDVMPPGRSLFHLRFPFAVSCVGFPTLCQGPRNLFIYLFICPRERSACHVVSICVQWAVKTGFQSAFFHSVLYGGHFSSQSLGFGELIRNFIFVSWGFSFPR